MERRSNLLESSISSSTVPIEQRPGESRITLACIDKTKKYLGWEPQVPLEEGILSLKNYYLSNLENLKAGIVF
jgi:nucleoside-diphosphate-sugar epimerase